MRKISEYQTQVATVREHTPVWEIADEMDAQSAGCVVVVSADEKPVGMVTDRDLLRRVVAAGRDDEKTTASDVMSTPVVSCRTDETLTEVAARMREKGVRRMPVLRDGELIGIVALDDIVAGLNSSLWNITDAVRIETREARRTAWRRRRREDLDETVEELRSQLSNLGRETTEHLAREVSDVLRRLGGRRSD